MATCAGQIVELIPEVQKDFHVRSTLAGAPRAGVLDLTDGAGFGDPPAASGSKTVFAHSLDECDLQVRGVTLRELLPYAYAAAQRG